jgi:hypothetical protein
MLQRENRESGSAFLGVVDTERDLAAGDRKCRIRIVPRLCGCDHGYCYSTDPAATDDIGRLRSLGRYSKNFIGDFLG